MKKWVRTLVSAGGAVLAVAVATGVVAQTSSAAFTAQTAAGSSTFSTASVALTNDKSAAALFSLPAIVPGNSGAADVKVTYSGTAPMTVKLFATGAAIDPALGAALKVTVKSGTEVVFDGTLAGFAAATGYANGLGAWTAAPNTDKTFTITWALPAATDNTVAGKTAKVAFTWEGQTIGS